MENIVEVTNLTRRFNSFTAVDSVSFSVKTGEVFGLLGPNGAGKTTTIKMLTTLLPPSGGSALVGGFDISKKGRMVRRIIGYVSQMLSVDGSLSGYENLLIFARLYDIPSSLVQQRIKETLDLIGLTEAAGALVKTYSGGMIRKLEIGQAIIHTPKILILDEPTVGLDPVARAGIWGYLLKLKALYSMSIFLTTHYMEEAESLCDRVAIMHKGKLEAQGTPAELCVKTGIKDATLDDAFAYFTGAQIDEQGGDWRETVKARRRARRLG